VPHMSVLRVAFDFAFPRRSRTIRSRSIALIGRVARDNEIPNLSTPFDRTRQLSRITNQNSTEGAPRRLNLGPGVGFSSQRGLLTLLFSCSSRIPRNHSLALIAVQPSFSTFHCKTLNILIKVCYSLPVVAAMTPRRLHDFSSPLGHRPPWSYHHTGTLPLSTLFATLAKTPGVWGHSSNFGKPCAVSAKRGRFFIQVFSFHTLPNSFALFCTRQNLSPFVFKQFRTLQQKHGSIPSHSCTLRSASALDRHVTKMPSPHLLYFPHLQTVTSVTPLESALTQTAGSRPSNQAYFHSSPSPSLLPSFNFQLSIEDPDPVGTVNLLSGPFHLPPTAGVLEFY
jgi:hypothetical protein